MANDDEIMLLKSINRVFVKTLVTQYSKREGNRITMEFDLNPSNAMTILKMIAVHLEHFLVTIIQHIAYHRKKCLIFSPLLNKIKDPRITEKMGPHHEISSTMAYEDIPFTAYDFYVMIKEYKNLIPCKTVYKKTIERLNKMESVRAIFPKDRKEILCEKRKRKSSRRREILAIQN